MQRGRGGSDAVGRKHGGLATGGHGGELAHRPVAVLIHAAHGAYVEVVVHIGRQACGQVLGGRGGDGSGLKGAGLGLTGADHILPAGLRVARHPAHIGTVGGSVADSDTCDRGTCLGLKAELDIVADTLYGTSITSDDTICNGRHLAIVLEVTGHVISAGNIESSSATISLIGRLVIIHKNCHNQISSLIVERFIKVESVPVGISIRE